MAAALAMLAMLPAGGAGAAEALSVGTASRLPVPRFVSLKSDRVNLREGPSKDHRTSWVFQRAGLPVEITAEFETWRRIRDSEGAEGWVLHSLLSGRRTALVAPWWKDGALPLFAEAERQGGCRGRSCSPACSARQELRRARGAASTARASTAGSSRTSCGASTRTKRSTESAAAAAPSVRLAAQPDDHVDAGDLHALRRLGQRGDGDLLSVECRCSTFSPSTKKWWWLPMLVSK